MHNILGKLCCICVFFVIVNNGLLFPSFFHSLVICLFRSLFLVALAAAIILVLKVSFVLLTPDLLFVS